ncbi:MAG: type I restriction enzyme HsdR N-terminal domain-containing protein [Caldisericia bacterium]|nr:type I restriction enzyme HsdR N-terminal domain-containing protein [Caldisericia bacterium]
MELMEKLMGLKAKIEKEREHVKTEQAAKTAFVLPFLQILGYDIFNPSEVIPEHTADWAEKKGEKVDYAIKIDEKIVMLFECKGLGDKLDARKANQLANYFNHVTDANIGVLTNGVIYKFYTDLNEKNVMDTEPFLIFDFDKPNEELIVKLDMFTKEKISGTEGREEIEKLRNYSAALQIIKAEFISPSEEFAKFIIHQISFLRAWPDTVKEFQGHLKKIIDHQNRAYFSEQLNKLRGQDTPEETNKEEVEETEDAIMPAFGGGIEFNNTFGMWEEFQGLTVAKSILHGIISSSKITLKDRKGFCDITYDGKSRSVITRMYFNRADKGVLYIEFPERDDLGKISIPNVQAMNDHREQIIESAKRFIEKE